GTKMVKHVISPQIPPVYLNDADRTSGSENPAYTEWEEQDSLLFIATHRCERVLDNSVLNFAP
ncbi:histone deacetylase, partial [Trifolium medium]|nr:histone deacetylase [Trifolium medium]